MFYIIFVHVVNGRVENAKTANLIAWLTQNNNSLIRVLSITNTGDVSTTENTANEREAFLAALAERTVSNSVSRIGVVKALRENLNTGLKEALDIAKSQPEWDSITTEYKYSYTVG